MTTHGGQGISDDYDILGNPATDSDVRQTAADLVISAEDFLGMFFLRKFQKDSSNFGAAGFSEPIGTASQA